MAGKLSRTDWNKTPYAGTSAKDTEGQLSKLLAKYRITTYQIINGTGPNNKPGFAVQFTLRGREYCLGFECLDAYQVDTMQLLAQVKRATYYHLKALLEVCNVWASPEEVLMPYLRLPNGQTMFQILQPKLEAMAKGETQLKLTGTEN